MRIKRVKSEIARVGDQLLIDRFNRASFFLLCIYFVDCAWSGAGRWMMFGPVSIRMLILAMAMLFSIPSLLMQAKRIFTNIYVIALLAFLGVLLINAVRGIAGNNNLAILKSDLAGFSYYLMFPTLLVTVNSRERLRKIMISIVIGSAILAIITSLIFADYVVLWMGIPVNFEWLFNTMIMGVSVFGRTLLRIFPFSGMFFTTGCACSLYLFLTTETRRRWVYPIITGLSLFALMISFTRAFYLALAVMIAAALLLFPTLIRRYKGIGAFFLSSILCFGLVLVPLSIVGHTNYFGYAVERTFITFPTFREEVDDPTHSTEPSVESSHQITIASDDLRQITVEELHQKISERPYVGKGLGAAVDCREDGRTEYFYLDLIHKTGIIGLFIYLLPLFFLSIHSVLDFWKKRISELMIMKYFLFCALLGFMVAGYFTPYMNAGSGISMFCIVMAADSIPKVAALKDSPNIA